MEFKNIFSTYTFDSKHLRWSLRHKWFVALVAGPFNREDKIFYGVEVLDHKLTHIGDFTLEEHEFTEVNYPCKGEDT